MEGLEFLEILRHLRRLGRNRFRMIDGNNTWAGNNNTNKISKKWKQMFIYILSFLNALSNHVCL
jgi:hypothetical protein